MIKEVLKNSVKEKPLVSFIIPAYNLEGYINRAINSIFEEDMNPEELEIVVINDGSTDKTREKIFEILNSENGKKFNWIFVDQTNGGVSVAWNVGLDYSSGEYIRFLGGDDTIPRGSTKNLLKTAKNFESDFVFGKFIMESEKGKVITKLEDFIGKDFGELKTKKLDKVKIIKDFICYRPFISLGNILIKKSTIDKEKIRFTPGAKFSEDVEFIAKVMYVAHSIVFLNEYVYRVLYRRSSSTKTANMTIFHNVSAIKRLLKYFQKRGENEIAKHIVENALGFFYLQTLGLLAYNKLEYRTWRSLVRIKEIREYIKKAKLIKEKKGFHLKLYYGKKIFDLSPTLLYVIMRVTRKYYEILTS